MGIGSELYALREGKWVKLSSGESSGDMNPNMHAERNAYNTARGVGGAFRQTDTVLLFVQNGFPCVGKHENRSITFCHSWFLELSRTRSIVVDINVDHGAYADQHGRGIRAPCTIYYAGGEVVYNELPTANNRFQQFQALPPFPGPSEGKEKRTARQRKFGK